MTTRTERFMSHVAVTDDCWLWTAYVQPNGYGQSFSDNRVLQAHRLAYELFVGPLGDLHVDHLCNNRRCVRPDHLDAVTQAENNRRSRERRGLIDRCAAGHDLTPENTYISPSGDRRCRVCYRTWKRRAAQRRAA